jgi:outer membrane biosynthesis protein TonB
MQRPKLALVFSALLVSSPLSGACGGSQPAQPATPGGPAPSASVGANVGAPSVGDAGSPTTTTQTLAGPGSGGTKLTPLASPDAGAETSPLKRRGEPGRTVLDLQAIVASHRDEARACYDNALPNHPGIEGTITIRWTIDPSGKVTDAELDTSRSEIVEPQVATCLISIIKNIHFNASAKGFETKANYPFNFHPRGKHTVGGS